VWLDAARHHDRATIARLMSGEPSAAAVGSLARVTLGGVWQEATGRLWCWRGATGEQIWQLYAPRPGVWWLVSCSQTLVALGVRRPDVRRLAEFIRGEGSWGGHADYLEGVERLVVGEVCVVGPGGATRISLPVRAVCVAPTQIVEEIAAALERITGWRERPLHLSAGLDSATILALGARRAASMSFPQAPESDEGPEIAALVAGRDVEHMMAPLSPWEEPLVTSWFEEALAWGPRAHPGEQYEAAFMARVTARFGQRVHVTGHGADQLLWATVAEHVEALWRRGEAARLMALWCVPGWRPLVVRMGLRAVARGVLSPGAAALLRSLRVSGRSQAAARWWDGSAWVIPVEGAYQADQRQSWGWEQLTRGLARRALRSAQIVSPFLDAALWEAAAGWGAEVRIGQVAGQGARLWDKRVLREALWRSGQLPEALVWRPKHKTFDAVIARVLEQPLAAWVAEATRDGWVLEALGVVDVQALRVALERYRREPRGGAVWRTLAAERWVRALLVRGG
jgi:asparagine synthetase B (glutamine-hydrolysing)